MSAPLALSVRGPEPWFWYHATSSARTDPGNNNDAHLETIATPAEVMLKSRGILEGLRKVVDRNDKHLDGWMLTIVIDIKQYLTLDLTFAAPGSRDLTSTAVLSSRKCKSILLDEPAELGVGSSWRTSL